MGNIKTLGDKAFRDYVTDGVPASGANPPKKSEIRGVFHEIDDTAADLDQKIDNEVATLNNRINNISVSGDTVTMATWAQLSAVAGTRAGQRGYVETDAGTHTDPVVGGTVQNTGVYMWSASPAGWRWLRSTELVVRANLTTEDLDVVLTIGLHRQISDANATAARHYPEGRAGTLEVISIGDFVVQKYTTWYGKNYWRTKLASFAWQGWFENARTIDGLNVRPNLTTEDLDTLITNGLFRQELDGNATAERHYPEARAGILEVVSIGNFTTQTYTTWWGKRYFRTKYGSFAWQGWFEQAKITDINQPYRGKTIAWIGDSIVEGGAYPTRVGTNLGATVHKFGFASSTMSKNAGDPNGLDKMTMYRFATAIASGDWSEVIAGAEYRRDNTNPSDDNTPQVNAMAALDWGAVDYMVIAFGTNDWAGSTPLGSALTPDPNGETFLGALAYAIETIQSAFPRIQIMLLGMSWRTRQFNTAPEINSDTWADAQGHYLIDYQDALLSAADNYRIPAYDMYRKSGVNIRTYGQYLTDGVHPNAGAGQDLWAKKAQAFLMAS